MTEQTASSRRRLLAEIHRRSQGIPRLINAICDNLLLTAFALESRTPTTVEMLEEVSERHAPGMARAASGARLAVARAHRVTAPDGLRIHQPTASAAGRERGRSDARISFPYRPHRNIAFVGGARLPLHHVRRGPEFATRNHVVSLLLFVSATAMAQGPQDVGARLAALEKLGEGRAIGRRQLLDADQLSPGVDDDRPRIGLVLRRPGEEEERARDDDAELRPDGSGDGALGRSRAIAWYSPKARRFWAA